nr:PREDICTED: glutathione S-transferase T3-like [Daucus carota subsp. sativus]
MNPNNTPSSNQNPNSQNLNPQFPYPYPNSYFSNPQNFTFNSQNPNSQYQFPHSQNSQFPFSYPQNSPYQFPFPPFSNPQFETQQTPINIQNSPETQVPAFGHENIIDLNDDCEEAEETRETVGQWKWVEDKLLISAWLNVSIDPLIATDQKAEAFWDRIRQYCEEDNPGVIKRGVMAMKKRWQRINEGAQKFGSCHDEAQRLVGSGANLVDIIEKAHALHLKYYKKKSNFNNHWRTKAAKRKGKGNATAAEVEEYEAFEANDLRKITIMETVNEIRQKDIETRQRELEAKQAEMDLQVVLAILEK